jgi:excisionase family DNA binding protein
VTDSSARRRRTSARPAPAAVDVVVDPLLTPDQVCALLKVRKEWLYTQVQRQRLPFVRINGRTLRFKTSDVRAYIDSRYRQAS